MDLSKKPFAATVQMTEKHGTFLVLTNITHVVVFADSIKEAKEFIEASFSGVKEHCEVLTVRSLDPSADIWFAGGTQTRTINSPSDPAL